MSVKNFGLTLQKKILLKPSKPIKSASAGSGARKRFVPPMTIETKLLLKRLGWSAVFIAITVYAIFWAPPWLFLLTVEAFIILGLQEYFGLVERKGFFITRYLGLTVGVFLPLSYYSQGDVMILSIAVLCLFIFNFHRRFKENASVSTALTLFGLVYVAWFFSFLTKIRAFDHGPLWVFYLILIVKAGDAAAYFVGKSYGKHKYIVHVSPNKSVEGAVAGFSFTFLLSLLSKTYLTHVPILDLAILGALFGILGQLGDLAESL